MKRNIRLIIAASAVVGLSACAPQRLQSSQIIDDLDGEPVYLLTGYTGPGEVATGSSIKHAKFAMEGVCPDGSKILSVNEEKTGNIYNDFLHWTVKAQCR